MELASKPRYAALDLPPVDQVHDGYFSVDNKRRPKDTRGDSAADVDTYDLIMRDKEKLLSLDEPLRFIFSHSALREGWDNPNVFQICTLNETRSTDRKRQEIGRGLRLPVDQSGERMHDPHVNRLTIIANEAYDQFARELQTEYEEDTGQPFGDRPEEAFAKLAMPAAPARAPAEPMGQAVSGDLWDHLKRLGYLGLGRWSTAEVRPTVEGFTLAVPRRSEPMRAEITDAISRYVFANRIMNAKKRTTVRFRKQVMLERTSRSSGTASASAQSTASRCPPMSLLASPRARSQCRPNRASEGSGPRGRA